MSFGNAWKSSCARLSRSVSPSACVVTSEIGSTEVPTAKRQTLAIERFICLRCSPIEPPSYANSFRFRSRLTGLLTGGREQLYANLSGGVTEDFLNNSSELIYLPRLRLRRALMRYG